MPHKFVIAEHLIEPPVRRAAYSDRTAWLMAVMSLLAYVRFEAPAPLSELAGKLAREMNENKIRARLAEMLSSDDFTKQQQELEEDLDELGFELVHTYSVSIPFVADTQAMLAKLTLDNRAPMLVLAFRGTESTKIEDIRADVAATPIDVGPPGAGHKVHKGFFKAFKAVQPKIRKDLKRPDLEGLPLYITGHSLGGALAVVATYSLSNDSVGACYTFGGPRVGNQAFGQSIKTPIYRVVNAADVVPRMPPSFLIMGLTLLLRWLPMVPYNAQIADFLEKFRHARHFGDLRYLTAAPRTESDDNDVLPTFTGLELISNPPQLSRWFWLYRRLIATRGRAGATDHSIETYVEKLACWGTERVTCTQGGGQHIGAEGAHGDHDHHQHSHGIPASQRPRQANLLAKPLGKRWTQVEKERETQPRQPRRQQETGLQKDAAREQEPVVRRRTRAQSQQTKAPQRRRPPPMRVS